MEKDEPNEMVCNKLWDPKIINNTRVCLKIYVLNCSLITKHSNKLKCRSEVANENDVLNFARC